MTKEIIKGTKETREIKQGEEDRFLFIFQFKKLRKQVNFFVAVFVYRMIRIFLDADV